MNFENRLHRTLANDGANNNTATAKTPNGTRTDNTTNNNAHPAKMSPSANALVRTVEDLNRKFSAAQLDWQDKLAEEQTKHRLSMLEQEELMQRSLTEPREQVRQLEDQVSELQSEMCVMVKDVSVSKKREQELRRRISQINGEKSKIEDGETLFDVASLVGDLLGDDLYSHFKHRLTEKQVNIHSLTTFDLDKKQTNKKNSKTTNSKILFRVTCDRLGDHKFKSINVEREVGGAISEFYTNITPTMTDFQVQVRVDVVGQ